MMRLIQTGFYEEEELLGEWRRRGNQGLFLPPGALLDSLKDDENLIADCIVCTADEELRLGDDLQVLPLPTALQIADEIARLDDRLTMPDGRKWKSLPVVILVRGAMQGDFGPLNGGDGVSVAPYLGPEHTLSLLKMVVTDYRQQLMNELDNLGLLVTYEQGRYRVGHVLGGTAATEGVYYAPHADRRLRFPGHLFTVDRDYLGVQREVEGFESLINDPEVTEPELQDFFERHPHFLPMQTLSQAIPQVRLEGVDGDAQIPDFVLRHRA